MALKPLRPCSDCRTALTRERYCERCAPDHPSWGWQTDMPAHKRGYGRAWKVLRDRVMMRDKYTCQVCKANGQYTRANEVDHITPKSQGGTDDPQNLQAICTQCHRRKTRAEAQQGKQRLNRTG